MDVAIRPLDKTDKSEWLDLWQSYMSHYGETASAHLTFSTFDRLVNRDHPLRCRLACVGTEAIPVGFVNYFMHESTWNTHQTGFIEDVYVAPNYRRQGIGKALVKDVARVAGINNWGRLYMSVPGTDQAALAFFGTLAQETDWVVFDYKL